MSKDVEEVELPDVDYEAYKNAHLPEGWLETPPMGEEIGNLFIPMKVSFDALALIEL